MKGKWQRAPRGQRNFQAGIWLGVVWGVGEISYSLSDGGRGFASTHRTADFSFVGCISMGGYSGGAHRFNSLKDTGLGDLEGCKLQEMLHGEVTPKGHGARQPGFNLPLLPLLCDFWRLALCL